MTLANNKVSQKVQQAISDRLALTKAPHLRILRNADGGKYMPSDSEIKKSKAFLSYTQKSWVWKVKNEEEALFACKLMLIDIKNSAKKINWYKEARTYLKKARYHLVKDKVKKAIQTQRLPQKGLMEQDDFGWIGITPEHPDKIFDLSNFYDEGNTSKNSKASGTAENKIEDGGVSDEILSQVIKLDSIVEAKLEDGAILKIEKSNEPLKIVTDIPEGSIVYVNGINTNESEACQSLRQLFKYLKKTMYMVYNENWGPLIPWDALKGQEGIIEAYIPPNPPPKLSRRPENIENESWIVGAQAHKKLLTLFTNNRIKTIIAHSNGNAIALSALINAMGIKEFAGNMAINYYGIAPAINMTYLFSAIEGLSDSSTLYVNQHDKIIYMFDGTRNHVWMALEFWASRRGANKVEIEPDNADHDLFGSYKWALEKIASDVNPTSK